MKTVSNPNTHSLHDLVGKCASVTLAVYVCFTLTACFQENNYADAFEKSDFERSFYLLKKEQMNAPDPYVYNLLGVHNELGLATPRDYKKAFQWYQKAAIGGLPQAQVNLGKMIEHGRGTTVDPGLAYGWYWAAFKSGHESALPYVQNLSGQLYPHLIEEGRVKVGALLNKNLNVID